MAIWDLTVKRHPRALAPAWATRFPADPNAQPTNDGVSPDLAAHVLAMYSLRPRTHKAPPRRSFKHLILLLDLVAGAGFDLCLLSRVIGLRPESKALDRPSTVNPA